MSCHSCVIHNSLTVVRRATRARIHQIWFSCANKIVSNYKMIFVKLNILPRRKIPFLRKNSCRIAPSCQQEIVSRYFPQVNHGRQRAMNHGSGRTVISMQRVSITSVFLFFFDTLYKKLKIANNLRRRYVRATIPCYKDDTNRSKRS